MYFIDPNALAQVTFESTARQAKNKHVVSELRRRSQTPASPAPAKKSNHHTKLWSFVHFHHAYS